MPSHGRRRGRDGAGEDSSGTDEAPATTPEQDGEIEIVEVVGMDEPAATAGATEPGPAPPEPSGDPTVAEGERDRYRDLLLRTRADFDNFQKRTAREADRLRATATADLLQRLLPVLDNLQRALGHAAPSDDPVQQGVALIHQQLLDVLSKEGLEALDTLGATFDPRLHEAVEVLEVEGLEPGTIVEEMLKGYRFRDRLLRPALVKVVAGGGAVEGRPDTETET